MSSAVARVPPPAPGRAPDVLAAVVTYNSETIIERFLGSLPAALAGAGTAEVVVVDNASTDATVSLVRQTAPWATVVESPANLGYGAGINLALQRTTPRRGVYVLNPDAVPSAGSVQLLARAVESDRGTGIAVPRILDAHGGLKHSLRREPTILRALGEAVLGGQRASRFSALGEVVSDPAHYVDGATADWATGAAMFIATRTVMDVGLWSEEYFLYSEETDYALRARDAGYRLTLVTGAHVTHPGGDLGTSPRLWSLAAVNRTRLYRSRHTRLPSGVYWCAVLCNEGLRSLAGRRTSRAAVRALLVERSRSGRAAPRGAALAHRP